MKIAILVLATTAFLVFNIYHDNKYVEVLKSWKKYYQMAAVAFLGFSFFLFLKKQPGQTQSLMEHANKLVQYAPIDKESVDLLKPLLWFGDQTMRGNSGNSAPSAPQYVQSGGQYTQATPQQRRMVNSGGGGGSTKRSVSETKKKFVAAQQGWKCKDCGKTLPAWFEVDHIVRLQHGGSNHVSNLCALCRDCHGCKTATETFDM